MTSLSLSLTEINIFLRLKRTRLGYYNHFYYDFSIFFNRYYILLFLYFLLNVYPVPCFLFTSLLVSRLFSNVRGDGKLNEALNLDE